MWPDGRLLFNILPFSTMTICSIAYKIWPKWGQNFAKYYWILSKGPKFFNVELKWRSFSKSGHTDWTMKRMLFFRLSIRLESNCCSSVRNIVWCLFLFWSRSRRLFCPKENHNFCFLWRTIKKRRGMLCLVSTLHSVWPDVAMLWISWA